MPAGSRRMSRSTRPPANPVLINNSEGSAFMQRCCNKIAFSGPPSSPTGVDQPAPPKHFPFPPTPTDGDIYFELILYVFVAISAGCQYLHLYRSVWWLPNSYNNQAMNFYLIDEYLVIFILVILSRRFLYSLGCKIIDFTMSPSVTGLEPDYTYFRFFLFATICGTLSVCIGFIMQNHPKVNIFYLCYPTLVYLILFGFNIRPFFESAKWCSNSKPPLHACTSNASEVRKEADTLRVNFNDRMRQILFSAVVNAYYAGFIPCCFAQPQLHYDIRWTTQHFFFIIIGSFLYAQSHILCLRYCDILHRCALHLGMWNKIEPSKNQLLITPEWRDDNLYPRGILVKYDNKVWRSFGECNASKPGDRGLAKFYKTFIFPSFPMCLTLALQLIVIMYQMFLLVNTYLWYEVISLSFMMFFNYYVLYKITRDYLVSYKVYRDEKDMHDKADYS